MSYHRIAVSVFVAVALVMALGIADVRATASEAPPSAVELDVASLPVEQIKLYQDRVEITRNVLLEGGMAGGETTLRLVNVSRALAGHTGDVKVALVDTPSAAVTDVSVSAWTAPEPTPPPERTALEDQLRMERQKMKQIQNEKGAIAAIQAQLVEFLHDAGKGTRLCTPSGECRTNQPSPAEFAAAMEFHREQTALYAAKQAEVEERAHQQEQVIQRLQRRLDDDFPPTQQFSRDHHRRRHSIDVRLRVQKTITRPVLMRVTYTLDNAGWVSSYEADLSTQSALPSLSLMYTANIINRCGEDWNDAAISLSTAAPSSSAIAPDPVRRLEARLVEPRAKDERRRHRPYASAPYTARGSMASSKMQMAAGNQFEENADVVFLSPPGVEEEWVGGDGGDDDDGFAFADLAASASRSPMGVSAHYRIPLSMTIPSDGQWHRATIAPIETEDLQLHHVAYPRARRHADSVFWRARATNKSPFSLLPGAVNVVVDGQLVGKYQHQKTTAPAAEIELFLGADRDVSIITSISRTLNETEGMLFMKSNQLSTAFTVTLTNHKDTPQSVILYSPIPYSKDETLVITNLLPRECTSADNIPSGSSRGVVDSCGVINSHNFLRYEVSLPPSKTREVEFKYRAKFPREKAVTFE